MHVAIDLNEIVERIERTMLSRGMNTAALVDLAKKRGVVLDSGTVGDMLAGRREPRRNTLGKILQLLDIDLEDDRGPTAAVETALFEDVVRADPTLIDEAKDHLIQQYDLLQRASAATPTNVAQMPAQRPMAASQGGSVGKRMRAAQDEDAEAPDVS